MSRKIIGITVGTQLPKPNFEQTDPTKGDYIKNKPDFDGLKSRVTSVEEALEGKQPVGDYALKSEIPSIAGLATEDYVDEKIANHSALPEGASAHQMLVTDTEGNRVWEERIIRPPEGSVVTIIPEQTVVPDYENNGGSADITEAPIEQLIAGETYTVNWNGTEYKVVAQNVTDNEITLPVIGNIGLLSGGESTGEPFIIYTVPDDMIESMGGTRVVVVALDESISVTFKVDKGNIIYHRLGLEYLPEYMYGYENGKGVYLPEITVTIDENENSSVFRQPFTNDLAVGEEYTVIWNGTAYNTIAKQREDYIYVGNISLRYPTEENTGEPFIICQNFDETYIEQGIYGSVLTDPETKNITFTIFGNSQKIRKIPKEFLPDGIGVPDWNANEGGTGHILNRTHYEESNVVVLPETTFEGTEGEIPAPFELVVGTTYRVTMNGTEYEVVAKEITPDGMTTVTCLGNVDLLMGTGDSGDPFVIIAAPDDPNAGGFVSAIDNTLTEMTFSIVADKVIHKLDSKFIPIATPNWNASKGEEGYIDNRTHWMNENEVVIMPESTFSGLSSNTTIIDTVLSQELGRSEYVVTWNGVDYTCKAVIIEGTHFLNVVAYLGNGSILGGEFSSEPFLFYVAKDETGNIRYVLFSYDGSTTATMKITQLAETAHQLNPKYIPWHNSSLNLKNGEAEGSLRSSGAHVENSTYTLGTNAFAVGSATEASGANAFAEGFGTVANGESSHAEGQRTEALGKYAHAEGIESIAIGDVSHAEGGHVLAYGLYSHVEGEGEAEIVTISGEANATEYVLKNPNSNIKVGNIVRFGNSLAEIINIWENIILVDKTLSSSDLKERQVYIYTGGISRNRSHAEGACTTALGFGSHAEGAYTIAEGKTAHAQGQGTIARYLAQDVIGSYNIPEEKRYYFAELAETSKFFSNAYTWYLISGDPVDDENTGYYIVESLTETTPSNFKEGDIVARFKLSDTIIDKEYYQIGTLVSNDDSGYWYNSTRCYSYRNNASYVKGKYIHIVGNGTSDDARSNAHTVDWNGNGWFAGSVYVGGTDQDNGSEKLMTQSEVMALLASILPTPTTADAGKILRVNAEGKYELVSLPNAEEASF